jgi:outer membrane receptor protein involved in Fe transport
MTVILKFGSGRRILSFQLAALLLLSTTGLAFASDSSVSGVVRDRSGAVVAGARVSLMNAQQTIIKTGETDSQGGFSFDGLAGGSYLLMVVAGGFAERRIAVTAGADKIEVVLDPGQITEEVTVTANQGNVESVESISQQVNVINARQIEERAMSAVAQVANEEVGVHLQRTSPTMAGIFVRGLTGNKVNVFIDGIRYSTSTQRGGVSTFLDLIDPSSLQAVEILRGPNSAQYGSDAIGGSVQFLSRTPVFTNGGDNAHGRMGVFFNSAEASFGSNLSTSFATSNFGLQANVTGQRVNTLRPGHGRDSHNAVTRFFGLSSDLVVDDRLPDTGFTQYGGMIKMNWRPAEGSQFTASYMRGQQDGGKRYDQLLGGDGNLIADLRNLMLDFLYLKYDKVGAGWLDSVSAAYSFNSQREERVNQGGNGNARAAISHEYERTNVNGVQAYATKLIGTRQNLVFGADFFNDRLNAPSFGFNPVTNVATLRRGRVPDNAQYRKGGVFLQDVFEAIPNKLRLTGNIRWNAASYRARTEDSPLVGGQPLWPSDSLRVDDWTYRAGVVVMPVEGLSLMANFSRGFRAPHLSDLDTLGLTGSGFEVPASTVAGLGATVGSSAGSAAVSTGRSVEQTKSETSQSYETGVRYHNRSIDTDFAFFVNDIYNNIQKLALILPPGAVGLQLGGETITAQNANGTVFVASSTNPVLVRSNFDDARIYGFEHTFDLKVTNDWSIATIFTYLHARDRRTKLPPNIEGGIPAPDGYFKIRYAPLGRKYWIEPYIHLADRQESLSTLDLEDRRTGATRTRSSISNFFNNGARFRGLVSAGPDGIAGNADDRLIVTGETLAQVQNRVLGVGVNSAPLYTAVPGYVTFSVRSGMRFGERHEVLLDFQNIGDRNYRGISWGVDAPGRGLFLKYNLSF